MNAPPLLKARRLQPGDTIGLVNPASAVFERAPYEHAHELLRALGFRVREAPNLRARHGNFAGTDAQRAADLHALFADPGVHGILSLTGGSGGTRLLPQVEFGLIGRNPKFFGGYSDLTALINAIHRCTGLVTFHAPMADSDWNAFSQASFEAQVLRAEAALLANPVERSDAIVQRTHRTYVLRPGRARGPLVGGNLAVLAAMAGSPWWPRFEGALVFIEEVNEAIYRVDRFFSTLRNAGAFERCAGVVLGGFTNCGPGERYGQLTLDEVFEEYLGDLGVPVFRGAAFGHIRQKYTLPVGLPAEMDADAGTLQLLEPAVL